MEPRAADRCFLGDVGFWVERTPVHEAAQRGESLQLQQLIESGACVNQVTVDSITPLHVASLQGQAQCVQLLLAAGAQGGKSEIWTMERLCLWYGFHITPAMKLGTQPTGHLGHRGVCRREGRRRWKCCIQNN